MEHVAVELLRVLEEGEVTHFRLEQKPRIGNIRL